MGKSRLGVHNEPLKGIPVIISNKQKQATKSRDILSAAFMSGIETVKFPIPKEEMQHRIKAFQASKGCYELEKLIAQETKKAEVRWKPAPDYPLYEVSSNGSVRNIKTNKVLKPYCNHKGYLAYTLLNKENIRKNVRANRLVLQVFEGQPQGDKQFACHKDGNQYNNHISNLYWGSHNDNAQDQVRLGVQAIGSRHGIAKLTEKDVEKIRQRLLNGERGAVIARDYKVDKGLIYKIRDNQIWKLEDKE